MNSAVQEVNESMLEPFPALLTRLLRDSDPSVFRFQVSRILCLGLLGHVPFATGTRLAKCKPVWLSLVCTICVCCMLVVV